MDYIFSKRKPKLGDRGFIVDNRFIPIKENFELPYGVKRLNYIESTGTQWIDTGISVDSNNGFELGFQIISFENSDMFGGGETWEYGLGIITHGAGETLGLRCGETEYLAGSHTLYKDRQHVFSVKNNEFFIDGVYKGKSNTYYKNDDITMTMFKHSASERNFIKHRIYYCLIFNSNSKKLRDFIPVLDKNNIPCFYDKITRSYFYNQGTGNFQYN